jgi:predicted AAA+ superfamily ATPase
VVENYISILEDILIAFRLQVFTKKAKRETVSHPKFYFFDAGVFQTLRPKGPLDQPEEISVAALEGLVAQHFRARNTISNPPPPCLQGGVIRLSEGGEGSYNRKYQAKSIFNFDRMLMIS